MEIINKEKNQAKGTFFVKKNKESRISNIQVTTEIIAAILSNLAGLNSKFTPDQQAVCLLHYQGLALVNVQASTLLPMPHSGIYGL